MSITSKYLFIGCTCLGLLIQAWAACNVEENADCAPVGNHVYGTCLPCCHGIDANVTSTTMLKYVRDAEVGDSGFDNYSTGTVCKFHWSGFCSLCNNTIEGDDNGDPNQMPFGNCCHVSE